MYSFLNHVKIIISCCVLYLLSEVVKLGACVALHEVIPKNRAQTAISSVLSKIRSSGARVILVFAVEQDAAALFDEALRYDNLSCSSSSTTPQYL